MKIIIASGVESRPAGRRAAHRDGHAHRAVLKFDRQHRGAGGIGALKKADSLFSKVDLHNPSAKEILPKETVDACRRARIDLPQIKNKQITDERHVTNPGGKSVDPARIRAALDSDDPGRRSQPQLQLARCVPVQSTKRSGRLVEAAFTFTQIKPSRHSKGISAPVCADAVKGKRSAASESRTHRANTQAFCTHSPEFQLAKTAMLNECSGVAALLMNHAHVATNA